MYGVRVETPATRFKSSGKLVGGGEYPRTVTRAENAFRCVAILAVIPMEVPFERVAA